jgi:hypothetical protein
VRRGWRCKDNDSITSFGTKDQTKCRMIEAKAEIVLEEKDPSRFLLFSLSGEELGEELGEERASEARASKTGRILKSKARGDSKCVLTLCGKVTI